MKLLANENIPASSVKLLREQGYDVFSVAESCRGASDEQVLKLAHSQQRIVVTFDADYGELVFLRKFPPPAAILFLRFVPASPLEPAIMALKVLKEEPAILEKQFIVVERATVRARPLVPES